MSIPEALRGRTTTDVTTAARLIGIGRNQAYALAKSGAIPSLRMGNRLIVPVAPLLEMLGIKAD